MPTYLIYPLYTAVIALTLIAVVPKAEIRRQAIYAISLGGVASVVIIFLYLPIKAFSWLNMGPFGLGHVAFSSPAISALSFISTFSLARSLDLSVRILRLLLQHDVLQCFDESWDSAMEQGPDRPALFPLLHMVFRGNLDLY